MARKDIDLSFKVHPMTGDLVTKSPREAIRQSVKNIVLTNYYERGFNVRLGTNVRSSLFENNVRGVTEQAIQQSVMKSIEQFEPQVEVETVMVTTDETNQNAIDIRVVYSIINNQQQDQISIRL